MKKGTQNLQGGEKPVMLNIWEKNGNKSDSIKMYTDETKDLQRMI